MFDVILCTNIKKKCDIRLPVTQKMQFEWKKRNREYDKRHPNGCLFLSERLMSVHAAGNAQAGQNSCKNSNYRLNDKFPSFFIFHNFWSFRRLVVWSFGRLVVWEISCLGDWLFGGDKVFMFSDSPLVKGTIGADVLFRGRINKDIEDYSEDEMYHIPLTKRGVVSSQRYSFPGLPCLYVGASVYTCWVELNRPSFENFQVATILPAKEVQKMNVFDLSNIPQRLSELRKEPWFNENEYFCYWPLMALSSIKVRHENDIFNPEYIFPQFLLEYVLNNNKTNQYIGIKYPSVKVAAICNKQFCEDWHTYVSYVFPSRTPNMKDIRCKTLENWFSVGHNRSGRELKVLADLISYDESKIKLYNLDTEDSLQRILFKQLQGRRIFTHDAKTYPYNESTYGMIEVAIQLEDFNVNNNPRLGDVCKVNEWDDDKV